MKNLILGFCLAVTATAAISEITTPAKDLGDPVFIDEKTIKTKVTDWLTLEQEDKVYVMTRDATMRIGPNAAFEAVGVMRKDETLESIGRARSWVAFEYGRKTVFIWEGLLQEWKAWPKTEIDASGSTSDDVGKPLPQEM